MQEWEDFESDWEIMCMGCSHTTAGIFGCLVMP